MTAGFYSYFVDGSVNDGTVIAAFDGNSGFESEPFYLYFKSSQGAGDYYGTLTFDIELEEAYIIE